MEAHRVVTSAISDEEREVILPYRGIYPRLHESVFVTDGAVVLGDVEIGRDSSVWFNAVIRGDVNWIRVGERTSRMAAYSTSLTRNTHSRMRKEGASRCPRSITSIT